MLKGVDPQSLIGENEKCKEVSEFTGKVGVYNADVIFSALLLLVEQLLKMLAFQQLMLYCFRRIDVYLI